MINHFYILHVVKEFALVSLGRKYRPKDLCNREETKVEVYQNRSFKDPDFEQIRPSRFDGIKFQTPTFVRFVAITFHSPKCPKNLIWRLSLRSARSGNLRSSRSVAWSLKSFSIYLGKSSSKCSMPVLAGDCNVAWSESTRHWWQSWSSQSKVSTCCLKFVSWPATFEKEWMYFASDGIGLLLVQ